MGAGCDRCGRRAVIAVRYSGRRLCRDHFIDFYVRRVKRELGRGRRIAGKVAVAVSGGKDSMALLDVMAEVLVPMRIEVGALAIDEGISGYRDGCLEVVRGFCAARDLPLTVLSFEDDVGASLDDIMAGGPPRGACSYCGVFRRHLLNLGAREMGADALATGHNLDDTAQTTVMNLLRGDIERMARTGPHTRVQEGLVPRVAPLRRTPEKENMLFCLLRGIPHHHAECPYSDGAHRRLHMEIVRMAEEDTPGTRHAIVNACDRIVGLRTSAAPIALGRCGTCGEPSASTTCMRCAFVAELHDSGIVGRE
ncbi:MAG: TIGR00269 family protein [Thermoplasmata archaeon]|nr:TIGR00269 family protein [Thermoplasmata archaeon]